MSDGFRLASSWPTLGYIGHVGLSWPQVGPSWFKLAQIGPSWFQVSLKLVPSWPMLGQVGPKLAPSWSQVGPKLAHVGPS